MSLSCFSNFVCYDRKLCKIAYRMFPYLYPLLRALISLSLLSIYCVRIILVPMFPHNHWGWSQITGCVHVWTTWIFGEPHAHVWTMTAGNAPKSWSLFWSCSCIITLRQKVIPSTTKGLSEEMPEVRPLTFTEKFLSPLNCSSVKMHLYDVNEIYCKVLKFIAKDPLSPNLAILKLIKLRRAPTCLIWC